MTNFERIKQFSREELAEYLEMLCTMGFCDFCTHGSWGDGACFSYRHDCDFAYKSEIVRANKYCEEGFAGFMACEDDGIIDEGLTEYRRGNCNLSQKWTSCGTYTDAYSYRLPGYGGYDDDRPD